MKEQAEYEKITLFRDAPFIFRDMAAGTEEKKLIGHAQLAGTGAFNPKYKDSKLGQLPTNGIFEICCPPAELPGVFLLCHAITKTDFARNNC